VVRALTCVTVSDTVHLPFITHRLCAHRFSFSYSCRCFHYCIRTVRCTVRQNRSPEEYSHGEQTERVDTFSMGNTFYVILTEHEVWDTSSTSRAQRKVQGGKLPALPDKYRNSTDAAVRAFTKAMNMCWALDQYERSSARDIADFLSSELDKIRNAKAHREGGHERKERTAATLPTSRS
jgi:hypothetical protein